MQYHLNGFKGSGDPLKLEYEGEGEPDFQSALPEEVDVLIVGAGPAGSVLGAQLARFAGISTRIVESRPGRLEHGHADGLQCRSQELFEAFGFAERVLREGYWVNETTFWSPTEGGTGLYRSGRVRDTEEGLSEMPHIILNQARLQDMFLEAMKWSPTRLEPSYNRKVLDVRVPSASDQNVEVTIERVDEQHKGQIERVRAKYVIGCDGAHSTVRRSLRLEMKGDSANQNWGVLDALVVTDFPDIRLKTVIHSAEDGSILIIPREGGYLGRYYIELDKSKPGERVSSKTITRDVLVDRAQRIFKPFKFEVKHVAWSSVYEVGQRLTDHFDDVPRSRQGQQNPRVFIAGDACHTHSAKAGQGMNVSMNDGFNLGWKLAAVLRGVADPKILHTYSQERHDIAQALIDFDREFSRMFAARPKTNADANDQDSVDPAVFQAFFTQQARFTAGVATKYEPGLLTVSNVSYQNLACGYPIGMRFQSSQVLRLADAKPVHLGHVMSADGRWRIVIFGNIHNPLEAKSPVAELCDFLAETLLPKYTPRGADVDSVIDVRAVFQQSRLALNITSLPKILLPCKGKFGIQDYEKAFTDEESYNFGTGEIYKTRDIDREKGCIVVVRPDQYVSAVFPLALEAHKMLENFFDGFMVPRRNRETETDGSALKVIT